MKNIQAITGIAAIVQGVALAVLLVFILVLLPSLGIGGSDLYTAAKILPAVHSPLLALFYTLFLTFGVTLVLIVLGIHDRTHGQARRLMVLARAASLAGLVAYSSYTILGLVTVSGAAGAVPARLSLMHVILTIAPVAAVTTTAVWGWAAAKAGVLPAALCWVVIAASLLRLVTIFNQFPILVLLQLGGSVVWSWWLAGVLLRQKVSSAALGASMAV